MKIRLKEVRRYKEHRLSDMRDEVRDLLEMQVSVLLSTVTCYANRAHNLTRSP